jgi:hypothetical protein
MHGLLPFPCHPLSNYSDNTLVAGSEIMMTRSTLTAEAKCKTQSDQTQSQLWSKTSDHDMSSSLSSRNDVRGVDTQGMGNGGLSPQDTHACLDIEETKVQEFRYPYQNQDI